MRYRYNEYYLTDKDKLRIEEVLSDFSEKSSDTSIIDILELYEINQFLIEDDSPWITDKSCKIDKIRKEIGQFFNSLDENSVQDCFSIFNRKDDSFFVVDYFNVFSVCFKKYKLNNKLSNDIFEDILKNSRIGIRFFLEHDCYRVGYEDSMKTFFLSNEKNIEIVLNFCTHENNKYKLLSNISKVEYSELLDQYLNSNNVEITYLNFIKNGIKRMNSIFEITPEQKVIASDLADELYREMDENHQIQRFSNEIQIFMNSEDYRASNIQFKTLLDKSWLDNQVDPIDFLNYFRAIDYMFEEGSIIGLCSFTNIEIGTLAKLFDSRTLEHYEIGMTFSCKNSLILNTVNIYQNYLENEKNLSIEQILDYFYNIYLKEKRDITFVGVRFPDSSYAKIDKTTGLFIAHELICKQTKIILEKEEVNHKIINAMSKPTYDQIRASKPVYYSINTKSDELKHIMFLMFSDQSGLSYINEELHATDFKSLIVQNKVKHSDLREDQLPELDFLIQKKIISIVDGYIANTLEINIYHLMLFKLYSHGSISLDLRDYDDLIAVAKEEQFEIESALAGILEDFIKRKYVIENNAMFTQEESNYLEYLLSDKYFDNSLGIRNIYSHGNIPENEDSDYLYALVVSVYTALKLEMILETTEIIQVNS